jgi:Na+/H+ antiporter NhaC
MSKGNCAGWGGTVLFIASWLMIPRLSAFSFSMWIGLMLVGAVMCFYGGLRRSRWFFLPSFATVIVTVGVLVAVYRRG